MILSHVDSRVDALRISSKLLEKGGSLLGVLSLPVNTLSSLDGMTKKSAVYISFIRLIYTRLLRESVFSSFLYGSITGLANYCCALFYGVEHEQVHAFFLDAGERIIRDEVVARGSVTHCHVYPEAIVKLALECNCTSVVIAHNHPSGLIKPSTDDVNFTIRLASALNLVSVRLRDHLIVSKNAYESMAALKLVPTLVPAREVDRLHAATLEMQLAAHQQKPM